jgi:hypothetical protein
MVNAVLGRVTFVAALVCMISVAREAKANFNQENIDISVGAKFHSLMYKRGIKTYEGYQLLPVLSVKMHNPSLLLAGTALYFKHELGNQLVFRTRINFNSTGDHPLYATEEDRSDRVRREKTTEWDLYLEYAYKRLSLLQLTISQDLIEHKGRYYEGRARYAVYEIMSQKNNQVLFQFNFFTALGYGTNAHNDYLYGVGAESGLNNIEYGLAMTAPRFVDHFWPLVKLTRFEILGDQNKNASYVQEKNGWSLELLAAKKIW